MNNCGWRLGLAEQEREKQSPGRLNVILHEGFQGVHLARSGICSFYRSPANCFGVFGVSAGSFTLPIDVGASGAASPGFRNVGGAAVP